MIRTGFILALPVSFLRSLTVVLLSVSLLGPTGCTTLLQPPTSPQTYVLDAGLDPPAVKRRGNSILLVETPRAEPGFDTPHIAYTDRPLALDYYTQSEWADTPARMLHPLVVRAMETTGTFGAVLVPPTTVPGDLRLDIDIIRLQQEFLDRPSRVRLTLRAKLIDMRNNEMLGNEYFEAVEQATSENAYGGVQAANRAVKRILQELAAFVTVHTNRS